LKKLDEILKDKITKNWVSVRKAFLDLDTDYDGFISVDDIVRYFGTDTDFSYKDLKKLMKDRDNSNNNGKISY
jgi:Ca2+-binding EF-hand superfamily protein